MTVLIVDDSLTVRMDLAEAIEAAGFRAIACCDLAEAREALRTHAIAIAILDVRLPDGSGVDLLEEIRAAPTTSDLPILMLSSEADIADRIRGVQRGANDYVGKPYDTAHVIARVRELAMPRARTTGDCELVLLIDDSATFRESLARILADAGYRVVTAESGTEGLRVAISRRPSAIIVDGVMPDMRGEAVVRRIRLDPALRMTPCLLLTGSDDASAEIQALDAGADAFARKGSEMELVLARFAAMLRSARDVPTASASSLGTTRVLAVDDTPEFLSGIVELLRDDGHDVVAASSGEQAIELIAIQPVDCVLLDLTMPGLSGAETCRRMKAAPTVRDIPLIVLSGGDARDAMFEAFAAGADDFVSKTAAGDVLRSRVKAQVRRKRLADEQRAIRDRLLRSELEAAEANAARSVAETRAAMAEKLTIANRELAAANRELEAFSYTVSHDLRAPLRAIRSFTQMIEQDAEAQLDEQNRSHLKRVIAATTRMSELIESLLELSRIGRVDVVRTRIDISALAATVANELHGRHPKRDIVVSIEPNMRAAGDVRLIRAVFDNLLGNAWKFSESRERARIDVGRAEPGGTFYVRDNGIGFDMTRVDQLFVPFQRLHGNEVPGTGVGLATVRRIIERHDGRIWAESEVGQGTTIFFTLAE